MKHQHTIRRGRMPFFSAVLAALLLLFGAGTGAYASWWEEDEEVFITQSIMLTYEGNPVASTPRDIANQCSRGFAFPAGFPLFPV